MATLSPRRTALRVAGVALLLLACVAAPARVAADDVAVTDQSAFETAVLDALGADGPISIIASGGGAFVAGSDWVLPGDASSLAITFNTSPFQVGNANGDAELTLQGGSSITLNTTSGSSAGRIEIGNGGTGALTLDGGTIQVNLADTSTTPGTSIGRIWVGGGSTNTTGGTGTLTITSGELLYSANAGSLNYGGLAVGRGGLVSGTLDQSGGTVRFSSAGALDLGTHGGTGTYVMSGDAVFDASSGGMTAYIGSRTSGVGGTGTASTGSLTISDDAQFSITTGSFSGGSLYVGDSKGTGTITQDGAGSSVTLTLANPIKFGSDQVSYGTGGTGTYNLSAGTLTVGNGGGSSQIVFGAASGGTGTFNISGGSADIAAPLILASVAGATGTVNLTGGALTLSSSSYLSFGSGTGTFNLAGGTFTVGGTDGIRGTGTFTFGGGTLKVGSDLTTSNAMTLTAGKTATVDTNGNSATLSGVLSGSGTLSKSGAGTLVLSGVNTYTGGTTIASGTVQIAANSGLGATNGTVTFSGGTLAVTGTFTNSRITTLSGSGGTIAPADGATLTWNGKISGSGALTIAGAGTLVLGGANDYTGGTTITSGTVSINADSRLGNTSGALTIAGGTLVTTGSITIARAISLTGAATISPSGTTTISSGMTGSGGLTKSGAGTLILTGANTYSGGTTISSGTLQIGNAGTTGSITGDVTNNATLAFSRSDTLTFGGNISGTGAVSKAGSGTLTLSGTNTYSGGTTVSGGTLQVSADANLGDTSGSLTISGSSSILVTTASFSSGRAVILGNGFIRPDDGTTLTLSGVLSGTLLRKSGGGTLVLTGTNTYTGTTSISGGTLQVSADANLGAGTQISFTTGTLATTGTFSSTRTVSLNAAATFAPATGTTLTLTGRISGSGSLTQAGTGTLVLAGANTYTGGTTISAGTLDVTGSVEGDAQVADGATLGGSGSVAGLVTVSDGGTLSGVQGAGLTMGGLVLSSGSNLDVTLGASSSGGVFTVNGDLTLDGTLNVTKLNDFGAGVYSVITYTGTLTDHGLDLASLGSGLLGLVQTSQSGEVNLVVDGYDSTLQFWNGSTTTSTGAIEGGDGTWTASPATSNWTTTSGGIPLASSGRFAVFQGTAGTVSIDNDDGDVTATGLQFVTSGYVLTGGTLTLTDTERSTIRVGNGTEDGAATVATIENVIAGTSGIEKTDYGTLILSAENTYSGGTTLSGGTLQISADGALGDASGGLSFDGGTLAVTGSFESSRAIALTGTGTLAPDGMSTLTLSGVISGTGRLVMSGDGTLVLTGTNRFSGGTTISGGTLQVGSDSALGNSAGSLVIASATLATTATFSSARAVSLTGNATIDTADATSLTLAGAISGAGSLTKSGTGTLIITGDASFIGTTTISAGTLQIGNGGTTGTISGDIVNNASLVFNRSDSYTITGSITGSGTLTLSGGGTATFTSSVSADVTLENTTAVLAADSTTAADFVVNDGGVLGGSATIGSLIVNAGGTVAPGYSPGTLTVDGPVTFNSGSVYSVDVTPDGSHDLIVASGDVTISSGASVDVLAEGGTYDRQSQLTILTTTGTLTGEFGSVTSNFAFLLPTLSYDATNVYLDLVYTGTAIDTFAETSNQAAVATAIQALGDGNDIFDAFTLLAEDAVAPALDQLSGEIYPSINTVIGQQGSYLRDAVGARLRQSGTGALAAAATAAGPDTVGIGQDPGTVAWAQAYGALGQTPGNGNAATISSALGGLHAGIDAQITDTLRAGLVSGYGASLFEVDERASSGSMTSVDLGAYIGAQFGALGLRGGASYGWHDIEVERSIVFPGFTDEQSASYGAGALQIFGEASYRLAYAGYEIEPFASLAYVDLSGGSASESGLGAAGLSIDIAGQQTLYTTIGTRLATTIELGDARVTPSLTLGWQHALGDTATTATMQSGSEAFTVGGVPIATDMLILGAGLSYGLSDALALELSYAGKFAEGASQNAVTARLSGQF